MGSQDSSMRWYTPLVAGAAIATTAVAGRYGMNAWRVFMSRARVRSFYHGGFNPKMTRREAALILGVRENVPASKIKEAHKRVMVANHPDAGGSDYVAAKVNEAKGVLLGQSNASGSAFH